MSRNRLTGQGPSNKKQKTTAQPNKALPAAPRMQPPPAKSPSNTGKLGKAPAATKSVSSSSTGVSSQVSSQTLSAQSSSTQLPTPRPTPSNAIPSTAQPAKRLGTTGRRVCHSLAIELLAHNIGCWHRQRSRSESWLFWAGTC